MIEARARVVAVEGAHAWVEVSEQPGGCGRCDEPGGCRSLKLSGLFRDPQQRFRLPNHIGARPGDSVRVCMSDGAPLRAALASYGLGALLTVCGGGLAALLGGGGDAWVLGGALGGLALAALVNRTLMRSRRWRGGLQMTVAGDAPSCTAGGAHG
ncbi:SoxR reducing system RseC family protein [Pseudothauera lacus]|uniref:SoxR reducing system RseC family protein n=1 Tax=Pseudothauera lacus TaxID=2136175 RepID=UPI001F1BA8A6|nr:SoxR reducing system RseC family protein [Pseudothauera lacus]